MKVGFSSGDDDDPASSLEISGGFVVLRSIWLFFTGKDVGGR